MLLIMRQQIKHVFITFFQSLFFGTVIANYIYINVFILILYFAFFIKLAMSINEGC